MTKKKISVQLGTCRRVFQYTIIRRSALGIPQNLEIASAAGRIDRPADAFLKRPIHTRTFSHFIRWLKTLSILYICAFFIIIVSVRI